MLRFPQADGRSIAPRKWSALKMGGPLIFFAELVQKKVIQHGFAVRYDVIGNDGPCMVRFYNLAGWTVLFHQTLLRALRIVARKLRVGFVEADCLVRLDQRYRLSFRYGPRDGKPVAVTLHADPLPESQCPF